MNDILLHEIKSGKKIIAEHKAKAILKDIVTVPAEYLCTSWEEIFSKAEAAGYPVVLKGYSEEMTHKTEHNIIHLNITGETELRAAYDSIQKTGLALEGFLLQKMVKGSFEIVMGLTRDPHFGPAVMLGLGGVFTELFKDVSFRIAPLTKADALEMMDELSISPVFDGFRKMPGIDRHELAESLIKLGQLALDNPAIEEIDINPLILSHGQAIAVDALIILNDNNA